MKQLHVYNISGIDEEIFTGLNDFDLEVKFHKIGFTASVDYNLLDFIVVSTIVISTDVIKNPIKDYTKSVLKTIKDRILNIWQNLKVTNPKVLKSGTNPSERNPRFRIIIRDKDGTDIIMEFDTAMSDENISGIIDKHFDLLFSVHA